MGNWTDLLNDDGVRLRIVLGAMLAAFLALGVELWDIQVVRHPEFQSSQNRQSVRRVRLPGPRGEIWDRNGMLLAGNRPSYAIALYVEELRQRGPTSNTVTKVESVVDALSQRLGLPRALTRDDIAMHIRKRRPLPLVVWRGVDERVMARWAESRQALPGVDILVEAVRYYPDPSTSAHLLGHVGRQEPDTEDSYDFYLPEMQGKSGMEMTLNERLAGEAGGRLLQVDASGFTHREAYVKAPRPGEDVVLTLDARIQKLAERELEGQRGACVVLDPRNGDVLALASAPTFPVEALRDIAAYRLLAENPDRPFVNRAIAGVYPPGSIFKPMVAIAALENGRAQPDTKFDCPGYFEIGSLRVQCWRTTGHGMVALREALEQSCNTYFCALGAQCGYPRIYHMAEAAGFGQRTGIELPHESSGLLPDSAWKERVHHDSWRPGDTANISIGQGFLLTTPLQMASFVAAIANGGHLYRPRLLAERREGDVVNDLQWSAATLAVVRGGMTDVVNSPTGTGKRARLDGIAVAGKTGSAEYGPRDRRKKYAWMIVFAPATDPRYAVAMVLEDAVSGGLSAAPRMRELLAGVFGLEQGPPPPAPQPGYLPLPPGRG